MNTRRKFHAAVASMHLKKLQIRRCQISRLQHLNTRMELSWNWKSEAFLLPVSRTATSGSVPRAMQLYKVERSRYFRGAEGRQQQRDKRVRLHSPQELPRTGLPSLQCR